MTSMRKVVITEFGDVDVLQIVEAICPPPPPGQVQIAVEYSGFTGGDIGMRKGVYPDQDPAPLTPGYCLVGTVRALGDGCTLGFKPGDVVGVLTKYDSQAELCNQPEKYCIRVPDPDPDLDPDGDLDGDLDGAGVDHQQVTALLCDWATAYAMTKHVADVQRGQRVFVHGLSGAVGCGLMIFCLLRGAEVYGTASARNHEVLRAYGAKPFVYTDKQWMQEMKSLGGAHAVFDPLGYESFDESYDVLAPDGILVAFGNNKDSLDNGGGGGGDGGGGGGGDARDVRDPSAAIEKLFARNDNGGSDGDRTSGRRTTFFGLSRDSPTYMSDVKALIEMVRQSTIRVPIKKVWAMDDVKAAHREWGGGDGVEIGIGSVVMRISGY